MHDLLLLAQSESDDEMGIIMALFVLGIPIAIYFVPIAVAAFRSHHNTASICIINIFLGWTFIGWVVALAMAFSAVEKPERKPTKRRSRDDDISHRRLK